MLDVEAKSPEVLDGRALELAGVYDALAERALRMAAVGGTADWVTGVL